MLLYNCNHSEDVDATLHTEGISDLPGPHEFGWYTVTQEERQVE